MLISLKTDYTMKQPAVRVYSCICTSSDGQSTGKSVVELIWPHWNIWLCWEKHRHTYFHPPFLSSLSLWQQKQKNYILAHVTIKNKPKKIGLWEKDKDRKSPGTKKESISQHAVAKCSITCSAAAEEFSAGGPPWSGAQTEPIHLSTGTCCLKLAHPETPPWTASCLPSLQLGLFQV